MKTLITLCYCQNKPASDRRGPWGRSGARTPHVGDPCARVFQRVSMNLNMTVGQAAHTTYCVDIRKARWLRPAFAESYRM